MQVCRSSRLYWGGKAASYGSHSPMHCGSFARWLSGHHWYPSFLEVQFYGKEEVNSMKKLLLALLAIGVPFCVSGMSLAQTCPAVGNIGSGCNTLITINNDGSVTITEPNSHPYDGDDDQIVGVLDNDPNGTVSSINLAGIGIAHFDGDG